MQMMCVLQVNPRRGGTDLVTTRVDRLFSNLSLDQTLLEFEEQALVRRKRRRKCQTGSPLKEGSGQGS